MKIAASDYDGTLLLENRISSSDLEAIKTWRAEGHLFGLVTGRDINLISHEVLYWGIPVDFLICSTGATAYDRSFNRLWSTDMPDQAWKSIVGLPALRKSRYFLFSQGFRSYINRIESNSWLTSLGLPLTEINLENALRLSGIQQLGLEYDSRETAAQCLEEIGAGLIGLNAQLSGICVDIMNRGVDKATGLSALLKIKKQACERLLTIGDSENDLSMIKLFNGYAIKHAPDSIKLEASGIYDSVSSMLLDNLA